MVLILCNCPAQAVNPREISGDIEVSSQNLPEQWKKITDVYANTHYNGRRAKVNEIPRAHHGAQHQARTAMWALVLLQLLREQGLPQALAFQDKDINLLLLACLFHDSGRMSEGKDKPEWEKSSGEYCRDFMKQHEYDETDVVECQAAIEYKSQPQTFPYKDNGRANLILWILHLSDALDVIRVRETFYPEKALQKTRECMPGNIVLAIYKQYGELAKVVHNVICAQGDWYSGNQFDLDMKKKFEHCANPLLAQFQHVKTTQSATFAKVKHFVNGLITTSGEVGFGQ